MVYFILHAQITIHHRGKSGQELNAGTTQECCLLAHSGSRLAGLLTQPKTSHTANGAAHNGLGPPTSNNSQYNPPQTYAQGNGILAVPQL